VGGGVQLRNIEVVSRLCQIINQAFDEDPALSEKYPRCPAANGEDTASLIRLVDDRPAHDRRCAIDFTKMQTEFGYAPRVLLDDGLRGTFNWYAQNHWWWAWTMQDGYVAQSEGRFRGRWKTQTPEPTISAVTSRWLT